MLTVAKETGTRGSAGYSVTRCEIADLADVLDGKYTAEGNRDFHAERIRVIDAPSGRDWFGGLQNLAACKALLADGWADGAAKARQVTPKIANVDAHTANVRRRVRWADEGTDLCIDRALAGDWDKAWRSSQRVAGRPRVLSIGCNFGGGSMTSHEQLFWCAAQMIVLTDRLEQAGFAVELHAYKCNDIHPQAILIDVLVKRPDQPLRPDMVAAIFGHAGCYRSYGHCLLTTSPYVLPSGGGNPTKVLPTIQRAVLDGHIPSMPDLVIEHSYNVTDATRAVEQALKTLAPEHAGAA